MRHLVAIGLVWFGCALAWMILGSTLVVRSGEASSDLTQEVHALWGPPMVQRPPRAELVREGEPAPASAPKSEPATARTHDAAEKAQAPQAELARLAMSDLDVKVRLEQRKKGLLWFPTYGVAFQAKYSFDNPGRAARLDVTFPLQDEHALYDGFRVRRADGSAVDAVIQGGVAKWSDEIGARGTRSYEIAYRSRGTSSWRYEPTAGTGRVERFALRMDTDFAEVDFLPSSLSPTKHDTTATTTGWQGEWRFDSLVANAPIGIALPQRLNPGPVASRITFFAPVGLLFFFFVVGLLAAAQKRSIHALNYFFFGCAFFAFHLLFAYLVDHLSLAAAFVLAALVSLALVVSYSRWFVGWKFALREIGISQLIYLVLFSFTFFFAGFTGLSIAVGAVLTLFVMMQMTGKARLGQPEPEARELAACPAPYRCTRDLAAGRLEALTESR
jgi:hypothetical protein